MPAGKPSAKITRQCRKLKIEIPQRAFADLILAGWDHKDAYLFSGMYNPLLSDTINNRDMERMLSENEHLIKYMDDKVKEQHKEAKRMNDDLSKKTENITDADIADALSKDTQLKELLVAKSMYKTGTKEWLDIKKMIADITQVKKEENKEEDEYVHFYVPLSCYSCGLYEAAKRKKSKK